MFIDIIKASLVFIGWILGCIVGLCILLVPAYLSLLFIFNGDTAPINVLGSLAFSFAFWVMIFWCYTKADDYYSNIRYNRRQNETITYKE